MRAGCRPFFASVLHPAYVGESQMRVFIVSGVILFNLTLFSVCTAMEAVPTGSMGSQNSLGQSVSQSEQSEVVNVVVDRIEEGTLYSTDGGKFSIGSAHVVDNSRRGAKMKTAELVYRNGVLATVTLR